MNGRSHTAVNAFSAVTLNSFFHMVGTPYSWHQLVALAASSQLSTAFSSPLPLYKTTFYSLVVLCARLPDIDQYGWIGRLVGGHRGFTHSCLGVLIMLLFFVTIFMSLPMLLATGGIVIQPELLEEVKVVLEAIIVGWTLHIMADGLTRGGVPLFWPVTTRYGFPPSTALRLKVGTVWEDIVLWALIFCAGFGMGTGILGL